MIVQFSFCNFKCFKDETAVNFVVPSSHPTYYARQTQHRYSLLKTLAFYGANGSGKSILFEALAYMRGLICPSKLKDGSSIYEYNPVDYEPFRLNTYSENQDSWFEVIFLLDGVQYRYGFSLNKERITQEWLYRKNRRETNVFVRDGMSIEVNNNYINKKTFNALESSGMIKERIPLLRVLAKQGDILSKSIVEWFESISIVSPFTNIPELFEPGHKESILSFMKALDLNIEDLVKTKEEQIPYESDSSYEDDPDPEENDFFDVETVHIIYNELYNRVRTTQFSRKSESLGTRVLMGMAWKIINSLRNGNLVLIDGIDESSHPHIIKAIINLFYKVENNAQLMFSVHNTYLLSAKDYERRNLLTPDQVYLVDKNRYGEASVTQIREFKGVNSDNMEELYLDGTLSGVPYINEDALMDLIQKV